VSGWSGHSPPIVEVALDLTGGNKVHLRGFHTFMLMHKCIAVLERDH